MRDNSGFGFDEASGLFTASEEVWDTYLASSHKDAKSFRTKPFAYYDKCFRIFNGTLATGKFSMSSTNLLMSTPSAIPNNTTNVVTSSSNASSISRSINLVDGSDDDSSVHRVEETNKRRRIDNSNVSKMIEMLGDIKDEFQSFAKPKDTDTKGFANINESISKYYAQILNANQRM